jgi:CBS domain-containing protein
MRDEDTGIVPVIDNEQSQRIVGVVTDRDLCMNVVAESREPAAVAVEQCMTTVVVTCAPGDGVEKATELMKENKNAETHDTLKKVSAPNTSPSKPRARSRSAA